MSIDLTKPVTARRQPTETIPSDVATKPADATEGEPAADIMADTIDSETLRYTKRMSRGVTVLALLAVLYTLYVGRSLLLPVTMAIVLALLFRPIVRKLNKWRIPSFIGAGLILFSAMGVAVVGTSYLVEPAAGWIDRVPIGLRLKEVEDKLKPIRDSLSDMNAATTKLQSLATSRNETGATRRVEIQQPSITTTVVSTTGEFMASAAICFVVLYFLLVLGDSLLNSVVQVMPRLREKREAVLLVRNVESGVSQYLLMITTINIGLGIAIGIGMWVLGLPNPALWGVMACALNFVPYVGAIVGTGIVLLVALLTFDSMAEAAVIPIVYFGVTAIEGNFVTPALLGNRMSLNPIVVFLSLAFWGWMWGIGGALLAVPLLAIFKIGCDQFECTRPLAVLVSR